MVIQRSIKTSNFHSYLINTIIYKKYDLDFTLLCNLLFFLKHDFLVIIQKSNTENNFIQ